ncbi:MAG: hypothetical protein WCJ96_11245, partial [Verrucomicrobiota bacterium]
PHERSGSSKYKPEYCDAVEMWGKQGKSRAEIATLLHLDRKTLFNWERDYEQFAAALARAMTASQAWWEGKAQKSLDKKHFQANLWRYSMAGRFKEDYAERPQATAGELVDFLSAVVDAAGERQTKKIAPGDAAKAVEAQDVVLKPSNKARNEADKG